MKFILLSLAAALPCLAQFRSIEMTFQGIGCESCIDSMPSRMQRLRGVHSATVDAKQGIIRIELAAQNRVRLEQVRDAIEQDGTKAVKAAVRVKGELSQLDEKWLLRPAGLVTSYEIEARAPSILTGGTYLVIGEVVKLRPGSGTAIVIRAAELRRAE